MRFCSISLSAAPETLKTWNACLLTQIVGNPTGFVSFHAKDTHVLLPASGENLA